MPPLSMPGLPYDEYRCIIRYLTERLKEEFNKDRAPIKRLDLRQFYLDEQLDHTRRGDIEYQRVEQKKIDEVIDCMLQKRILKIVLSPLGSGFIVDPSFSMSDLQEEAESQQNCELRDGEEIGRAEAEVGNTVEVERPRAEQEQDRHDEAYAEMTESALSTRDKPNQLETPSKKRRRTDEIAGSEASSRFDSMSPGPARPSKRLATPDPDTRRSAPSRLQTSPNQANTPQRRHLEDDAQPIPFKAEPRKPYNTWLEESLRPLHDKYPNDRFTIEKGDILCIDCEGRLFSSRTGGSNFEKHLKSKSHREIVASRLAYAGKKSLGDFCSQPVQYDTSLPKGMITPSTIQCYSLPNVPFSSSTKGQPDLQTQRANMLQYFDTLTSGTLNQEARTRMIEARLVASVDETKGELESVRELVAASEKRSKTQYTKIDEALATSEARNKDQTAEVDQRLKSCQAENNSQLERLSETIKALESKYEAQVGQLEEVINDGDKQTKRELERIEGKVALFQQQNQERHDELKKQISSSEGIDAKIKQCQQENKQYSDQAMNRIHLLERKEVQTALARTKKDEQFRQMTEQIRSLEQIEEERALAEQNGQDKHNEMEGHLNTMMGKIFLLEEANVKKEQDFIDLESAIQLQSEQFQSQQKKGEELTESMTAQLNLHFSKTADQITAMEKASHKRMAEFEQSKSAAIQSLEEIFSGKTRVLEEANAEQTVLIQRYEAMFPAIIEDASDLREEIAELREEVERLEKEANERRRRRTRVQHARRKTLGVRFDWSVSRGKTRSRESMAPRGSQAL